MRRPSLHDIAWIPLLFAVACATHESSVASDPPATAEGSAPEGDEPDAPPTADAPTADVEGVPQADADLDGEASAMSFEPPIEERPAPPERPMAGPGPGSPAPGLAQLVQEPAPPVFFNDDDCVIVQRPQAGQFPQAAVVEPLAMLAESPRFEIELEGRDSLWIFADERNAVEIEEGDLYVLTLEPQPTGDDVLASLSLAGDVLWEQSVETARAIEAAVSDGPFSVRQRPVRDEVDFPVGQRVVTLVFSTADPGGSRD